MYYEFIYKDYPTCNCGEEKLSVILKNESSSPSAYEYSFRFAMRLTCKEMFEIAEWCDENIKDGYLVGCATSGFENKLDAMAFRLRWC